MVSDANSSRLELTEWRFFGSQFPIIEFDPETFRILLDYLHTGSCPLTCSNIPGLICAAEHYDLPELLQACFHHAKQFLRIDVVSIVILKWMKWFKKCLRILTLIDISQFIKHTLNYNLKQENSFKINQLKTYLYTREYKQLYTFILWQNISILVVYETRQ